MSGIEKPEYDVIIVGSGPAGVSTALHLIKLDPSMRERILILEKHAHPRKKSCGGGIGAYAQDWLKRLNIELAIPFLKLDRVRHIFDQKDSSKDVITPSRRFGTIIREEFDEALWGRAMELDIPAAQNEPVISVSYQNNGMRVRTPRRELTTRVVVGADGAKGIVGRTLRREFGIKGPRNLGSTLRFLAPDENGDSPEHRNLEAVIDFSGTLASGIGGYAWSFPVLIEDQKWLNTGVVGFQVPQQRSRSLKEILAGFLAARGITLVREQIDAHPIRWFDPSGFFSANRVVLVGDAAGIDPFWGEGISFSIGYGEIAARSILQAFNHQDYAFTTYKKELLTHEVGRLLQSRFEMAQKLYRSPGTHNPRDFLLSVPTPGRDRENSWDKIRPAFKMKTQDPTANLMLKLINDLKVNYRFECSFKISQKKLLENRFLLVLIKEAIKPDPHAAMFDICKRLGMPQDFLKEFNKNIPDAACIDFGFEKNEKSSVYKVYLDFGAKQLKAVNGWADKLEPFMLYQGFKWDTADNTRRVLTEYTWFPNLSFEGIREKLAAIFEDDTHSRPYELANDFMNLISKRASHDRIIYLGVTEENNPRKSFDVNLYNIKLQLKEVYPQLARAFQNYSIPDSTFHELYNQIRTQTLGHISGGINRQGEDFFTIYYGAETVVG